MRYVAVQLGRGRALHAASGIDNAEPRVTLCKRDASTAVIHASVPTCRRCLSEIARRSAA